MTKILWLSIISIWFAQCAFCQNLQNSKLLNYKIIGNNKILIIKAIKRLDNSSYYLLINNKNKVDSLLFAKDATNWGLDICIITERQLDQTGRSEIIIEHSTANQEGLIDAVNTATIIQIWNLDSRIKMFEAVTNWDSQLQVLSNEHLDNNYEPTMIFVICSGSYELEFIENGEIQIKDLYIKSDHSPYCKADHEEGKYILKNGKYIFKKD